MRLRARDLPAARPSSTTSTAAEIDDGGPDLPGTHRAPTATGRRAIQRHARVVGWDGKEMVAQPRPRGHPDLDGVWTPGSATHPALECDWTPLTETYRRSLVDLAALRFAPLSSGGRSLPAAGLPWFMTMFGRDSIFTSLQALPFAARAGRDHPAGTGRPARYADRRLPRRGSGPDPARDALRRVGRVRGAAAHAVLRQRRRHAAVRRPARRVRAVDRRRAIWYASWSTRPGRRWRGSTTTPT